MEELKTCSTCNGIPVLRDAGYENAPRYYVSCTKCGKRTRLFKTKELAINTWNQTISTEAKQ